MLKVYLCIYLHKVLVIAMTSSLMDNSPPLSIPLHINIEKSKFKKKSHFLGEIWNIIFKMFVILVMTFAQLFLSMSSDQLQLF